MLSARLAATLIASTVMIGACSKGPTSDDGPDGLPSSGSSSPATWRRAAVVHATYQTVADGLIVADAWLLNGSSNQLVGLTGYCDLWYRVYRDSSRSGTPLWRTEDSPGPVGGLRACPAVGFVVSLAPGDSVRLPTETLDALRLVAAAGPGIYYMSVLLTLHEPEMALGELPAGELVVARP
jgi:hypothetical protein